MKKFYSLILSIILVSACHDTFATIWNVNVNSFSFSPNTLPNVTCGDTVKWTLVAGSHTTTSTTIPSGATPWDAPINSSTPTFSYFVPNFAGVYNYKCTPHGFTGSFTVICPAGIDENESTVALSFYPNPFNAKVIIRSSGADAARIVNILGETVLTISFQKTEMEKEMDLKALAAGVYFCIFEKGDAVINIRKVVKTR